MSIVRFDGPEGGFVYRGRRVSCAPPGRHRPIPESGLIFACVGCCCGHPERGGPKTPPRTLKREIRRAFRESGIEGRLRLAFTDCLGPCSEANVVFVYLPGRSIWLRRVNDVDAFLSVVDWARSALDDGADGRLPPALATRSFVWAGSGEGPAPPIER